METNIKYITGFIQVPIINGQYRWVNVDHICQFHVNGENEIVIDTTGPHKIFAICELTAFVDAVRKAKAVGNPFI